MTTKELLKQAMAERIANAKLAAKTLLEPFCSEDEYRTALKTPWSWKNHSYASDGRILVQCKHDETIPAASEDQQRMIAPQALKLLKGFPKDGFKSVALPPKSVMKQHEKYPAVRVREKTINYEYLWKIGRLPEAKVHWAKGGALEPLAFIFKGGRGLLMPMRMNKDDKLPEIKLA